MNTKQHLTDRDRWLAAEYALGVLSGSQMKDAEKRARTDAAFRKEAEAWQSQLSPLLDEVEAVPPSNAVWKSLETQLFPAPANVQSAAAGTGVWKLISAFTSTIAVASFAVLMFATGGDFTGSKYDQVRQEVAGLQSGLADRESELRDARDKLAEATLQVTSLQAAVERGENELSQTGEQLGQALASLDTVRQQVADARQQQREASEIAQAELASMQQQVAELESEINRRQAQIVQAGQQLDEALAALDDARQEVVSVRREVLASRPLVASLTQAGEVPAFVAQYDPYKKALLIRTAVEDKDEKVPEVWLIPAQGDRKGEVLSLGVMDESAPDTLPVNEDFVSLIGEGGTLAITMEPPGGAPEGVATGPVIALGTLQAFE